MKRRHLVSRKLHLVPTETVRDDSAEEARASVCRQGRAEAATDAGLGSGLQKQQGLSGESTFTTDYVNVAKGRLRKLDPGDTADIVESSKRGVFAIFFTAPDAETSTKPN